MALQDVSFFSQVVALPPAAASTLNVGGRGGGPRKLKNACVFFFRRHRNKLHVLDLSQHVWKAIDVHLFTASRGKATQLKSQSSEQQAPNEEGEKINGHKAQEQRLRAASTQLRRPRTEGNKAQQQRLKANTLELRGPRDGRPQGSRA